MIRNSTTRAYPQQGKTMIKTLYAEFTVKPGSEGRVAEMMRELAHNVRREPGNQLFLPYTCLLYTSDAADE